MAEKVTKSMNIMIGKYHQQIYRDIFLIVDMEGPYQCSACCLDLACLEHYVRFSGNFPCFSKVSKCCCKSNLQLGQFLSTFNHDFAHSRWKICLQGNRFIISPNSRLGYLSKTISNKLCISVTISSSSCSGLVSGI